VLSPRGGAAQTSGNIAGVVRDATGAVLPGVTVEVSSPALIEKTRSTVTNGEGQYMIIDLRPGTYLVTFQLAGFSAIRREGIELTSGFTAAVSAELKVGAVEETVTVSGQSPLVDAKTVTQRRALSSEVLDSLPTGRAFNNVSVLVPGVTTALTQQDVGGISGMRFQTVSVHGSRSDQMPLSLNGMPYNNMNNTGGGYNSSLNINPGTVQEITVTTGGLSAEQRQSGVWNNTIPKDGGNTYSRYLYANYANEHMQSSNLSQSLIDQGLLAVPRIQRIWDLNPAGGGPIMRDHLWFYTGFRYHGSPNYLPNAFYSKTPLAPQYCANSAGCLYGGVLVPDSRDLSHQAVNGDTWNLAETGHVTWQVSPRNKATIFGHANQRLGDCFTCAVTVSPEAAYQWHSWPEFIVQTTWSHPHTNKLLIEGGFTFYNEHWFQLPPQERAISYAPDAPISKVESVGGVTYGAVALGTDAINHQFNIRFSASYVTGSHNFKVGMQDMWGTRNYRYDTNQAQQWNFTNGAPRQIVQYARPWVDLEKLKAALGVYAQDQWSFKQLTLNLGVRFDYQNAYVPEQNLPAIPFVAARHYDPIYNVPNWKDLSPRVGASYDLFGTGRTAVRASFANYVASESVNTATLNNPVNTSINSATRTWTDNNGNFVPDCVLTNPAANGECGLLSAPLGALNIVTHYDPAITNGWGVRPNDKEIATGIQHQLLQNVSLDFQFTRHWFGNFFATQNRALPPDKAYTSFCIMVPVDPRLPGGGGNQLCGFKDVNPPPFQGSTPDNWVTKASTFGKVTDVYTGYDVNMQARFPRGGVVSGGVSLGRELTDTCAVIGQAGVGTASVNSVTASTAGGITPLTGLQSPITVFCHIEPPFQPDIKFLGTYPLPWWGLTASATFQNRPGPNITGQYTIDSNQAIGLGRPLSVGQATTQLIAPGTIFGDRVQQIDIRFGKIFQSGRTRIRASIDLYNLLNSNVMLALRLPYSLTNNPWLQPSQILQGRLLKIGAQMDF
jgi:hypothetical protein